MKRKNGTVTPYVSVSALAVIPRVLDEQPRVVPLLRNRVSDRRVGASVSESGEGAPERRKLLAEHRLELALGVVSRPARARDYANCDVAGSAKGELLGGVFHCHVECAI